MGTLWYTGGDIIYSRVGIIVAVKKRERLITIGIRKDLKKKIKYEFPTPHEYKPVLRDVLQNVPESVGVPYGENKKKIFELVPPGGYWRDIDPEIAKAYMKSYWEMEGGRYFWRDRFCLLDLL